MAQGQIYVEVDASSINGGIMPMAIVSGNPEPVYGQDSFGVWLTWYYNDENGEGGFTGISWYIGDKNNILTKDFENEQAFKDYLALNKPINLDNWLQLWDVDSKSNFLESHKNDSGFSNCYTFINPN